MKRLVGKNTSAYLPVRQHKVLFTSHVDMINQPQLLTGRTLAFEKAPSVFNSGFSYRGLIGPHGFWQEWLPSALPDQQYKALKGLVLIFYPVTGWGKIISTKVAKNIIDRFVCDSEILIMGGPSYRIRSQCLSMM